MRYKGESKLLPYSITVDGKICVELKSSSAEIEARIRYEGFDSWSPWIATDEQVGCYL